MRYIRRFGDDRAVIARLTIWRRLALALICLFIVGTVHDLAIAVISGIVGIIALASAVWVALLKLRTTTWP